MKRTFQTFILGSSAAIPTALRHTTAQLLQYHNKYFLLDCAEGTQMQLRRHKKPMTKINHIFISHMHGDHFLGLPGLLFSLHLLGREKDLHIYAPPGLKQIIDIQYEVSELQPSFQIHYHELHKGRETIYEDEHLIMETMAMNHRLPTFGLLIREKPSQKNISKKSIARYNIPVEKIPAIKEGDDFVTNDNTVIPNKDITTEPPAPRSYAFCSDTAYTEDFIDQISGADLLYHEATFMHASADIARRKMHSTTVEAATLAQKAHVGKLMIGHYSARYKEMEQYLDEAAAVFPETIMAGEGETIPVKA